MPKSSMSSTILQTTFMKHCKVVRLKKVITLFCEIILWLRKPRNFYALNVVIHSLAGTGNAQNANHGTPLKTNENQ